MKNIRILIREQLDFATILYQKGLYKQSLKLLEKGSAFYAPATSAIEMAEAYLKDQKRLLPCAAYCNGEFGLKGMYVGVPAIIGSGGIERIADIQLDSDEQIMFDNSVKAVKGLVDACKAIDQSLK